MADNVSMTEGSGKTARSEDIGGFQHQYIVPVWGPLGTANKTDIASGKPFPIQLRSPTGTDLVGTAGSGSAAVLTVQGSATGTPQPVSGTFWQATQPVSIATAPITPVTGTFWQTTQPISGTVSINAIPTGTNNIGDVDILTVPADPFGVNADAASVTGSISAKLRALSTAVGTNVITRGVGATDVNTLRVSIASEQVSGSEYEDVAAGVGTPQMMGTTGAVGDYIEGILVIPETNVPGAITLTDGNLTAVTIFTGGASSVSNLVPFYIQLGHACVATTTPGWKITTGANVHVRASGNFT